MKKNVITLAAAAAVVAAPMMVSAADESSTKANFFGYSQITAAVGKGKEGNTADSLRFGADSIRLGYQITHGKVWGKLQADFNKTDKGDRIGIPEIIQDAVVGYKFNDAAKISAGIFKTPVGMDFGNASKQLDITKRGLESYLVLNRAAGLMVSGRKLGGFGYDVGVFNPAQRSGAVDFGEAGDGTAYAGRVMYDMNEDLHIEASYGVSTQDSGSAAEDYTVFDLAGYYKMGAMTFKAEYIFGSNVKGKKDYDESVWYVHGGYAVNKMNEIVLRHYAADSETASGNSTSLGNTYLGWNIFLAKKQKDARIQLNYVFASGDTDSFTGIVESIGYTDNVLLAQFQVGF
ncbi:MAG: porin [Gammaproteobacteria bacterium]|nr:porin [Gammaproteobacteria bacterium]